MPYNGDIYSPPAGTKGAPKTTIQSSKYNTFLDDITDAQNTARPVTAGGTGATNATQARVNLGLDKVLQYGAAQTLTQAEKARALGNIGAAWEQIGPIVNVAGTAAVQWNDLGVYVDLRMKLVYTPAMSGGQPFLRVSINNGASFVNGALDYLFNVDAAVANTMTVATQSANSFIPLAGNVRNGVQCVTEVTMSDFNTGGSSSPFRIDSVLPRDSDGQMTLQRLWGFGGTASARNAIQFAMTNGSSFTKGYAILEGRRS